MATEATKKATRVRECRMKFFMGLKKKWALLIKAVFAKGLFFQQQLR
jgi:hypothetical protein